jgi:hypothetical protein
MYVYKSYAYVCIMRYVYCTLPSPTLPGKMDNEISKLCSFELPMKGLLLSHILGIFSTFTSSCRSCIKRKSMPPVQYITAQSRVLPVSLTAGSHGLMTRITAYGTIVNFSSPMKVFFHYNKIFEQLRSRKYLQAFYSVSSFSYA